MLRLLTQTLALEAVISPSGSMSSQADCSTEGAPGVPSGVPKTVLQRIYAVVNAISQTAAAPSEGKLGASITRRMHAKLKYTGSGTAEQANEIANAVSLHASFNA